MKQEGFIPIYKRLTDYYRNRTLTQDLGPGQKIDSIIGKEMSRDGKSSTNRHSPGYCNWPVKNQQELFSFFPEKFCRITLSPSSLMHPIKSVSGFIGIGQDVKFRPYTCANCKDMHCIYRRLGKQKETLSFLTTF